MFRIDYEYLDFSGLVTVSITYKGAVIKPAQLHAEYKIWITDNHEQFDKGAAIDESSAVIVSQPQNKEELNITDDGEKPRT